MTIKPRTYEKAVEQFLDMATGVTRLQTITPRRLSAQCGIPHATGYRITACLEKHGIFERDASSILMAGIEARRIGFAAWGAGAYAEPCAPVLTNLRREASLTAFLGFKTFDRLSLGAFSVGRSPDYVVPRNSEPYGISNETENGAIHFSDLKTLSTDAYPQSTVTACFKQLPNHVEDSRTVIGVLMHGSSKRLSNDQRSTILLAASRLTTSWEAKSAVGTIDQYAG